MHLNAFLTTISNSEWCYVVYINLREQFASWARTPNFYPWIK